MRGTAQLDGKRPMVLHIDARTKRASPSHCSRISPEISPALHFEFFNRIGPNAARVYETAHGPEAAE